MSTIQVTGNGIDSSTGDQIQRVQLIADDVHEATFEVNLAVDPAAQTIEEAKRISREWTAAGRVTPVKDVLEAVRDGVADGMLKSWCATHATCQDVEVTAPAAPEETVIEEAAEAMPDRGEPTESGEFPPAGREL